MGWQACIEAGQSLLFAQTEHSPLTHRGLAVGHALSEAHSTHPSAASQMSGALQPAAQSPPVKAPLGAGAGSSPQASGTKMSAGTSAASEMGKRRIMAVATCEGRVRPSFQRKGQTAHFSAHARPSRRAGTDIG